MLKSAPSATAQVSTTTQPFYVAFHLDDMPRANEVSLFQNKAWCDIEARIPRFLSVKLPYLAKEQKNNKKKDLLAFHKIFFF